MHWYQRHREFEREICFQIRIHVKCSGISERGKSDHIQYHTFLVSGERGTMVWQGLRRSYVQVTCKPFPYVTSSAHLTCFHQVTWPGSSFEVHLPCWILNSLDCSLPMHANKRRKKKKSNSRRILLLMECHYNFVIKKLLTYIIYTQKRKWYCRRPISC